jgi:hypothetical protein
LVGFGRWQQGKPNPRHEKINSEHDNLTHDNLTIAKQKSSKTKIQQNKNPAKQKSSKTKIQQKGGQILALLFV